ncbi:MAG: hypothetical protein ABW252_15675 [Polyangiales bacterium]
MRLRPQLPAPVPRSLSVWLAALGVSGCMQAAQTYPLDIRVAQAEPALVGSLSVERVEGGQRLVVLELSRLPPPERIAPGLREFVVWLEGPKGDAVKAGTLRYDRVRRSGNLLATTDLTAFTVRVTGERDSQAVTASGVLLAERRIVTH